MLASITTGIKIWLNAIKLTNHIDYNTTGIVCVCFACCFIFVFSPFCLVFVFTYSVGFILFVCFVWLVFQCFPMTNIFFEKIILAVRQSEAKYKRSDSIQFVFLFHFQFRNLIMWTMFTCFGNMWTWKEFKKYIFNRYFFLKNWFQCIKQARLLDYQILL